MKRESWRLKFISIVQTDWVISLLLLGVFLATNGYTYGWDDQHLEIPLLKRLINPDLYPGDYYVDALVGNFITYLYPILSRLITTAQIPAVFFLLYLISRYVLFFFMYKLWHCVSKDRFNAFLCVSMIILLGRVEEFLYRTFSHQEFALAIIFGGLYLFYRKRYVAAAAVLGLAANVHVLYSIFPLVYILWFLFRSRPVRWKKILQSISAFILCALPILIWIFRNKFLSAPVSSPSRDQWWPLYQLACPQNFLLYHHSLKSVFQSFSAFWQTTAVYWQTAALFLLNIFYNPVFQKDKRSRAIMEAGTVFLLISFLFTYIWPSRFVIDLNLIRNLQFMTFVLMAQTVILIYHRFRLQRFIPLAGMILFLPFFRLGPEFVCFSTLGIFGICTLDHAYGQTHPRRGLQVLGMILLVFSLIMIAYLIKNQSYSLATWLTLAVCLAGTVVLGLLFCLFKRPHQRNILGLILLVLPFFCLLLNFSYYHYRRYRLERYGSGFWQLQRAWLDMQDYVREHTPQDALFLVPHDMEMGGFRIGSERSIIMSYRDCGVVGFDYAAGEEWQKRLEDIGAYQVFLQQPPAPALKKALETYQADYIVALNYLNLPESPYLDRLYANEVFALYNVRH
ncbi:MAG: DUF6798 domain-containing protein [Candidatus Omnitrophota bacterium]